MRAEDIFWYNEPQLERIGEEGRKKLIKLIEGMDKTATVSEKKPKPLSDFEKKVNHFKDRIIREGF